jgi:hypothetical protein
MIALINHMLEEGFSLCVKLRLEMGLGGFVELVKTIHTTN